MSKSKRQALVDELVSLREMAAELADEITAIEDTLKANMQRQDVDTIEAGKAYHPVCADKIQPL